MIGASRIAKQMTCFLVLILVPGWIEPWLSTADEITFTNGQKRFDTIKGFRGGKLIVGQAGAPKAYSATAISGFQITPGKQTGAGAAGQDIITFSNGDKRTGKVIGYRNRKLLLELAGQKMEFDPGAIAGFQVGAAGTKKVKSLNSRLKPPTGVAPLVQRATGVDVQAETRPLGDNQKLAVISEKGISVPVVIMGMINSSFYGGRGCYIRGTIRNDSLGQGYARPALTRIRGYDFVLQVYDAGDKFLTSQRFYLFRFPPGRAVPFTVHLLGVDWQQVAKIRITRRF